MYILDIDRSDPLYLKTFDVSSIYFYPENQKKTFRISFPNIFNLDGFFVEINKFKQIHDIDGESYPTIIHDYTIDNFDVSLFTSDGFFLEQILSAVYDNTHTHVTITNGRPIFSSFNGTFIDDTQTPFNLFTSYDYLFPPLKQTQNGIEPQNILCKENLELVLRANDSPACVTSESTQKLIERGWKKIN